MEKIYSIFVSSTFEDLREERAEVQKALLKLKCFPVGMELFPSTDIETWEFIKRQIANSDYYLLIIGGKYGSVDENGVSFTEKEYDYAKEIGKRAIAFVHGDRSKIEAGKTELDHEKRQKLEEFIKKVRSGPLVQTFMNPHELAGQVTVSLVDLRDRSPATGFVRADQVSDPKKYADLLEENAKLKSDLAALSKQEDEEIFYGADEEVGINCIIGDTEKSVQNLCVKLVDFFIIIAETIIETAYANDQGMHSSITKYAQQIYSRHVEINYEDVMAIKKRLVAKQLINFTSHLNQAIKTRVIAHVHNVAGPMVQPAWDFRQG
jgi:hypothetical protein